MLQKLQYIYTKDEIIEHKSTKLLQTSISQ